ncbi:response regulator transcription factor [Bacillus massiliigorillae]|uniref:response regulator transcription factor n=1 Tax=Bacillus massiliigorillae TaxID=1243664 RepID=UPI00039BCB87|nr:response regulator transcription factor [Bacillus massiliigorillae]
MARVMVVEDQSIVRQGIAMMLKAQGLEVVAEAENGKVAIEYLKTLSVDVIMMDIRMPEMNGLEATRIIHKQWPQTKIIILTTFNDDEYAVEALKEGACGYLLKTADSDKLVSAVKSCLKGGMPIQEEVTARVIPKLLYNAPKKEEAIQIPLTPRELDIAKCVGMGKTNKEIAQELFMSVGTVKNHITVILQKLEMRDRTQLAIYAVKNHIS